MLFNYFETAEIEKLKQYDIQAHVGAGWTKDLVKAFYFDRDIVLSKKILANLEKSPYTTHVIVVGAAHLGGHGRNFAA